MSGTSGTDFWQERRRLNRATISRYWELPYNLRDFDVVFRDFKKKYAYEYAVPVRDGKVVPNYWGWHQNHYQQYSFPIEQLEKNEVDTRIHERGNEYDVHVKLPRHPLSKSEWHFHRVKKVHDGALIVFGDDVSFCPYCNRARYHYVDHDGVNLWGIDGYDPMPFIRSRIHSMEWERKPCDRCEDLRQYSCQQRYKQHCKQLFPAPAKHQSQVERFPIEISSDDDEIECRSYIPQTFGQKLYFMESGEFVKIGISKQPEQRLRDLQNASPHPIRLLSEHTVDEISARELEQYLHYKYRRYNHRREWFRKTKPIQNLVSNFEKLKPKFINSLN